MQLLDEPIPLLFLDYSLSNCLKNIFSEAFANIAIFHQGF